MGCQPSQNRQLISVQKIDLQMQVTNLQTWQLIPAKTSSIFDEYHFMQYISRNNNSYLRVVQHLKSKIQRIAKVYHRTQKNQKIALRQINALKKMDHPNIVRLHEYFLDESNIYLILEKVQGQELFSHLLGVDEKIRENFPAIFRQLLTALQHCHSRGYVHRNIYPQNILIVKNDDNFILKLVGFGMAVNYKGIISNQQSVELRRRTNRISMAYRPPQSSSYTAMPKTDIWMAGLILLMVITGRNFTIQLQKQDLSQVIDEWQQQNPEFYRLVALIRHMLQLDPSNRYSAKQCLKHPFFIQNGQQTYKWRITLIYNFLHNFKQANETKKLFQMHILHRISSVHQQTQFMLQFQNLDKNKDGLLQANQLVQGLLNSYSVTRTEAQKYVDQIFEKLDRNHNKQLQYSEFLLGTMQIGRVITQKNVQKVFNQMDANGDGYISIEEIKKMFDDIPIQHQIFKSRKGISLNEFKGFMLDVI